MGTKYKKPNQLSLSESIALYGDKERAITYEMDAKERAAIRRHNRLLANRPKYNAGCYSKKIYEMGTQSLYNPSQTNPASQALAGYNTGSVTGATPGLDARSAIPGLGIGLDNIVGGGINAIGSYMHGENQRQKMMAQNRNQQDMVASQNSQMRRFGAVEGQQTDTVLRNEDLNSLNSSYQRMYEEGTEAVDTNAPTPDSAMIEVEKDELIFRRFGASYQLVADFIGGDTHEEGGEPFVAEEGDVIFPGAMRDMILPMVDDSGFVKYKFMDEFEELRQQLPEDTPQGTAENQAVSDEIIGTGMQMAETPKFEMGGTVNPAQAETLQPMQTNVGPPTQLKQNLNIQRNEQNILNQLSGQSASANQIAPSGRMPIAGEEFANMAGQGPINPDYKAEQPLMGNQEYVNRAREQAMLNEQKATLFPQQQEAMQKAINKRENKGRVFNRFGNNDSLIQTNGMSAGDFMFALGQDIDYQTQQNMRNYQSQYPMGTKYYKPKRYDEGTASANPPSVNHGKYLSSNNITQADYDKWAKERLGNDAGAATRAKYMFGYLNQFRDRRTGETGFDAYKKAYKTRHGIDIQEKTPFEHMKKWYGDKYGGEIGYGGKANPYEYRKSSLYADKESGYKGFLFDFNKQEQPGSDLYENIPYEIDTETYNVSAGSPTNVTYTDKIVTRDVPKEVVNNQTQLEVQKEMVPTSINDNRTFNDSRSRWQNNNQGNAISGHFNSGGYSIVDGNIIFNPGGGINIGNQNVTQNQNDYNQGMYGNAGGSGIESVKAGNDAETSRVQQKQQAVNTENANNANKIITAQQESNSQYQSNKTAAVNEAMSGNEAARKAVMEQQAANRQAEIAKAVQAGADAAILQKKMDENQQPVPETPKEIKEFKKGTKYISKDKLYFNQDGGDYKSNDDITLNQKFKGDIGDGAVVGNAMAVSGSGNNLNANKSYTGNQIHNIRTGHDINIGDTKVNSDILNRLFTPQPTENKSTEPYVLKYAGDDTYNSSKPSTPPSKPLGSTDKPVSTDTKPNEKTSPSLSLDQKEDPNLPFVPDVKGYNQLSDEEKQLDDFLTLLNTLIPSRKLTPGELDKQNRGLTVAYPENPKIPVANRNLQLSVYKVPKKVNQTEQAIRSGTMVGPRTPDKYLDNYTAEEIEDQVKKYIIPGYTKYRRGSKSVSKDRTESNIYGSDITEDSDVDLNQKFKGDIGSESMAGVGTGIMGQGNNINQNRSITRDQIHNIRSGHNINIGNLGGMDGLDPNIDMKSLGKGPRIRRYKDSATALGPMGMQNMNTTNVNLEQKNYADLSDPMRLAAQNATMQATQAGAMAGGGAGLAGVIAAQNQGLDTRFGVEAAEAARLNQTQQANVDIRNQSALTNAQNKIAVDQFNTSNAQSLTSANKGIEAQNAIFRQSAINAANNRALQQAALDRRNRELAVQVGLAGLTAKTQMGMANRQLASDVVNNALTSTGGGVKTPTGPPAPPILPPNTPGDIVPQAPEIRNRLQQLYAPNPNAEVPIAVDIPGEGEQKLKHGTKYKKVRKFAR